jgi:hypothetical protein
MWNAEQQKMVFILGAGFSAYAKYPLVKGLRKAVLEEIQSDREGCYFWCERWREEFSMVVAGADATLSSAGKNPEHCFEELLLFLKKDQTRSSAAITTDRILRRATGRLLWKLNKMDLPNEYNHFVSHAKRAVGLISFNWDVLVETALWCQGIPWGYRPNNWPLPVVKPHGSINWSSHEQQDTSGDPMWQRLFCHSGLCWIPPRSTDDQSATPDPAFQDPFSDCSNSDLNYMLFPGDPDVPEASVAGAVSDKAISDRHALWDHASLLIQKSDKVVFLGYSLPGYDDYAVNRLKHECKGKRVVVVNPCPDDAEGIKRNLGPDVDVEVKLEKFEDSEYAKAVS